MAVEARMQLLKAYLQGKDLLVIGRRKAVITANAFIWHIGSDVLEVRVSGRNAKVELIINETMPLPVNPAKLDDVLGGFLEQYKQTEDKASL